MNDIFDNLTRVKQARTKRCSSWDVTGRNMDAWIIPKGETRVLADIKGPGKITHIWMTQGNDDTEFLRKILLRFYWDGEENPSILVPLGDFFCLGHGMVNSFQSLFFTASTGQQSRNKFGHFVALNCYLPMPFNKSARVELVNETEFDHYQYFYIDYETYDSPLEDDVAYLHACFRRENPTNGWAHEITANAKPANIINDTDKDNYLLMEAEGEGHLVGFNLSVTNLQHFVKRPHERTWWGEGDEMIFIDGEEWPPSIHGTGSEDFLNQAFGMQPNAYLYNGSSIYEHETEGYQTSYVFYVTNPVRFTKSVRASIEHGHGNHLSNEYSSVAYWYQKEPHKKFGIIPVRQRVPLVRTFAFPEGSKTDPIPVELNEEMKEMKKLWEEKYKTKEVDNELY